MPDVVDLIMSDHREVERVFGLLQSKPDLRPTLVPVLTALLAAHSRAEESEVYPVARDEAGEAEQVKDSQQEHLVADQVLERLSRMDPTSPDFDSTLGELVKAITHHVQEEESQVLPGLRERLDAGRLNQLGVAFAQARAEHLGAVDIDLTKVELEQQARNAGIEGAAGMTKAELERELAAHAEL